MVTAIYTYNNNSSIGEQNAQYCCSASSSVVYNNSRYLVSYSTYDNLLSLIIR